MSMDLKDLEDFEKQQALEIATDKSLRERRIKNYLNKEKVDKKKLIKGYAAMFAIGLVAGAASMTAGSHVVNDIKNELGIDDENDDINKYLNEDKENLANIVEEAIHNGYDPKDSWIDYGKIGNYINEQDNKDTLIYLLYTEYGSKKGIPIYNDITNKSVRYVSNKDNKLYNGFDDYLKQNNIENIKEYKDQMESYILAQSIIDSNKMSSKGHGGK